MATFLLPIVATFSALQLLETGFGLSVAVLPFANTSNDPEQAYFSDGITEDIIPDLSNVSGLFVLSRNTVFAYKGRTENVERIARELGVAYVVEGSVRKAVNRVRINAELIEGATDGRLWAARCDRDLTDIFAAQDEITKAIVDQLKVKLLPEEKKGDRADAVAVEVVAVHDDVAEVHAHAELEVPVLGHADIALVHAALDLGRAAHGVHHAAEFDQEAVAHHLEDAPAMSGDGGIEQVAAMLAQRE
jgi:TolB-like protein